jgi:hypothetical protein
MTIVTIFSTIWAILHFSISKNNSTRNKLIWIAIFIASISISIGFFNLFDSKYFLLLVIAFIWSALYSLFVSRSAPMKIYTTASLIIATVFISILFWMGRNDKIVIPLIGAGQLDWSIDVGHGYHIFRPSAFKVSVSPNSITPKSHRIPTHVIQWDFDSTFVIAKRIGVMPTFEDTSISEPDSNIFDYWILNTSIPKVYGPLTLDEFMKLRENLGVSDSLSLKKSPRPLMKRKSGGDKEHYGSNVKTSANIARQARRLAQMPAALWEC